MSLSSKLDELHYKARQNKWLGYFAVFNRIALAAGFIPSGMQKILGERFTVLANNHPMGNYLEAVHHTGYYYTFIGVMQVLAAILLLIPRTATLGAVIYFPIILNICILSLAVRFDGSMVSSSLMVLATLYLLCWDYHKFKFILPFNSKAAEEKLPPQKELKNRFPLLFFIGVAAVSSLVVLNALFSYNIVPRNTIKECTIQCEDNDNPAACLEFCDCIHTEGSPLDECLKQYNKSIE